MDLIKQARVKMEEHKLLLRDTILDLSFQTGEFKLKSGRMSDYYIDLRKTTMDSTGIYLIAEQLWWMMQQFRVTAIGGVPLGSIPIVGAVLAFARVMGTGVDKGFMVRKATKDHGTQQRIEGNLDNGDFAAIIEDVVTSGSSALEAARAVKADRPALVQDIFAVVDREEGGREAIEKEGIVFTSIFTVSELKRGLEEHTKQLTDHFKGSSK
jgi:orotate phosphoribosyltransferase